MGIGLSPMPTLLVGWLRVAALSRIEDTQMSAHHIREAAPETEMVDVLHFREQTEAAKVFGGKVGCKFRTEDTTAVAGADELLPVLLETTDAQSEAPQRGSDDASSELRQVLLEKADAQSEAPQRGSDDPSSELRQVLLEKADAESSGTTEELQESDGRGGWAITFTEGQLFAFVCGGLVVACVVGIGRQNSQRARDSEAESSLSPRSPPLSRRILHMTANSTEDRIREIRRIDATRPGSDPNNPATRPPSSPVASPVLPGTVFQQFAQRSPREVESDSE